MAKPSSLPGLEANNQPIFPTFIALTNGLKTSILRGSIFQHLRTTFFRSYNLANSAQARKRARQADKSRILNASQRSEFRTSVKKVVYAIEAGDKNKAAESYKVAVPIIDAMAGKGIITKNKAARHKSRLNARIKALA
jgi:small subunit ribosomal protein S20